MIEDVPELIEAMTAKQIREHMTTMHCSDSWALSSILGRMGAASFSKAAKSDLLVLHEKLHSDEGYRISSDPDKHWHQENYHRVPHEHGETTDLIDADDKAEPGTTPRLTPAERRTLERLVDMDFDSVQAEIAQYAADLLQERMSSLDEEFKAKQAKADKFAEEYRAEITKHQERLNAIVTRAREEGLSLTSTNSQAPVFNIVDKDAKRAEITREVNEQRDRAVRTLTRKRLGTQRTVLLTGLGGNVEKVLNSIPSATEVMAAALAETASVKAITS